MTNAEIIHGLESVKAECGKHLNESFAWICQPIDEAIKALEQEPKTGHWISYWDEEARCYVYKCPECGNKQPFDTKCCWECGTRLVEPQESEETDADSN
jgi:hypothetical protein